MDYSRGFRHQVKANSELPWTSPPSWTARPCLSARPGTRRRRRRREGGQQRGSCLRPVGLVNPMGEQPVTPLSSSGLNPLPKIRVQPNFFFLSPTAGILFLLALLLAARCCMLHTSTQQQRQSRSSGGKAQNDRDR